MDRDAFVRLAVTLDIAWFPLKRSLALSKQAA
jgi:hypothetical protein